MFKLNYHILTIVTLFCSLGIGILVGMTMGEDILFRQQEEIIDRLENHFEEVNQQNKVLKEEKKELEQKLEDKEKIERIVQNIYGDIWDKDLFVVINQQPRLWEEQLKSLGAENPEVMSTDNLLSRDSEELEEQIETSELIMIIGSDELQDRLINLVQSDLKNDNAREVDEQ